MQPDGNRPGHLRARGFAPLGRLGHCFGDGLGASLDGIAFGAFDGPLGPALSDRAGQRFHLAGRLEINTWQGRQSVQMRLEDAATA